MCSACLSSDSRMCAFISRRSLLSQSHWPLWMSYADGSAGRAIRARRRVCRISSRIGKSFYVCCPAHAGRAVTRVRPHMLSPHCSHRPARDHIALPCIAPCPQAICGRVQPRVQPSRCSGELLHESVTGALCPGSAIDEQVLKLLRHPRQCAVSTCCAVSVYGAALPLCAHDHIGRVRPQDPQDPQHGSSPGRLL
jgi:hypothetical protein